MRVLERWVRAAGVVVAVAGVASGAGAQVQTYAARLSGSAEFPPNASPGTGFSFVTYDPSAHSLRVQVTFANLLGTTVASHIHCCVAPSAPTPTAGVATPVPTFTGFPLGVTSGAYDHTFDLTLASSWNPAFVTAHTDIAGAESFFASGLAAGTTYLNIHTTVVRAGEIRGFLVATPEPATVALVAGGLLVLGGVARRRRA